MNPMLLILVKLLASSALLTGFYVLLFRGKSSYTASRVFLLAIPLLSVIFSLVNINSSDPRFFSMSSLLELRAEADAETVPIISTEVDIQTAAPATTDIRTTTAPDAGRIPIGLLAAYLLVTAYLVGLAAWQMVRLRRIRQRAERRVVMDMPVFFSYEIKTSFSVMRSIYISTSSDTEKTEIIVRHEQQHILHRHYIDLALMEFITTFMWFNPAVWIIRRELRGVHEFQVDRSMLDSGVGMRDYMLAILGEAAGAIPAMANGINSSLIKKRFLKMKNGNKIRLRALRMALTVPFTLALFAFFAFTPAEPQKPEAAVEQKVNEIREYIEIEMKNISVERDALQERLSSGSITQEEMEMEVKNMEARVMQMEINASKMEDAIIAEYGSFTTTATTVPEVTPEMQVKIEELNRYIERESKIMSARHDSLQSLIANGLIPPAEIEAEVKKLEEHARKMEQAAHSMQEEIMKMAEVRAN